MLGGRIGLRMPLPGERVIAANAAAEAHAESQMKWLLVRNGVDPDVQRVLWHFGYKTSRMLSALL